MRLVEDYYPLPGNPDMDQAPKLAPPSPLHPPLARGTEPQSSHAADASQLKSLPSGVGLKRKRGRPSKDGSERPAGKARTKKSVKARKVSAPEAQAVPGKLHITAAA